MKISKNTIVLLLLVVVAVVAFLISWKQLHTRREGNASAGVLQLIDNCKKVKPGMTPKEVGEVMNTSGVPQPVDQTHMRSIYEPEVKPENNQIPLIQIDYEGTAPAWKVTRTVCGEQAK